MKEEILMAKGRLSELELKRKDLEINIKGLRDAARMKLSPITPIPDLDMESAYSLTLDMLQSWLEHKEVCDEIKAIEKALGI
jgi:hypothetical protein